MTLTLQMFPFFSPFTSHTATHAEHGHNVRVNKDKSHTNPFQNNQRPRPWKRRRLPLWTEPKQDINVCFNKANLRTRCGKIVQTFPDASLRKITDPMGSVNNKQRGNRVRLDSQPDHLPQTSPGKHWLWTPWESEATPRTGGWASRKVNNWSKVGRPGEDWRHLSASDAVKG